MDSLWLRKIWRQVLHRSKFHLADKDIQRLLYFIQINGIDSSRFLTMATCLMKTTECSMKLHWAKKTLSLLLATWSISPRLQKLWLLHKWWRYWTTKNKMKRVCHKSMIHPLYLLKFSELIFIQNIGGIGIISSSEKHLIAFLDYENPYSCFSKFSPCGFIPAKTTLARALMPKI